MDKSILKRGFIISIIHLSLTVGLMLYGFDLSSLDSGLPPPLSKRVANLVSGILARPGLSLWTSWMSKSMPNSVEWFVFMMNSCLWGFSAAWLFGLAKRMKHKQIIS